MIDFETPAQIERQVELISMLGEQVMRPIARYYDQHEGERPWDYINMIWQTVRTQGGRTLAAPSVEEKAGGNGEERGVGSGDGGRTETESTVTPARFLCFAMAGC